MKWPPSLIHYEPAFATGCTNQDSNTKCLHTHFRNKVMGWVLLAFEWYGQVLLAFEWYKARSTIATMITPNKIGSIAKSIKQSSIKKENKHWEKGIWDCCLVYWLKSLIKKIEGSIKAEGPVFESYLRHTYNRKISLINLSYTCSIELSATHIW